MFSRKIEKHRLLDRVIQLYALLSPYFCFINFHFFIGMFYVSITYGHFMRTKYINVLINI